MQNGELMATLRIKRNMSQNEMAKIIGISLSTYKLYETNMRIMKLNDLNCVSNYFNVSLDSLLALTKNTVNSSVFREINYNRLKFNLIFIRKRNHFKQSDLAKILNVSKATIIKYEKNPHNVNVYYLYLFAKTFNVSIDFICGKSEKKEILF